MKLHFFKPFRSLCHPRMRHNSADHVAGGVDDDDDDQENNNYENFAHELSNPYLWPPMMTNTRDFSNSTSKRNIDLNSTNRYGYVYRSIKFGKLKKVITVEILDKFFIFHFKFLSLVTLEVIDPQTKFITTEHHCQSIPDLPIQCLLKDV